MRTMTQQFTTPTILSRVINLLLLTAWKEFLHDSRVATLPSSQPEQVYNFIMGVIRLRGSTIIGFPLCTLPYTKLIQG